MLAGLSFFAAGCARLVIGNNQASELFGPKDTSLRSRTMDLRKKLDPQKANEGKDDRPGLEEQDWEAIESGALRPDSIPENGDLRYDIERTGEALEEDDDNPYQNSDEALPEDRDEAAIGRNPAKEGGRFDEV